VIREELDLGLIEKRMSIERRRKVTHKSAGKGKPRSEQREGGKKEKASSASVG